MKNGRGRKTVKVGDAPVDGSGKDGCCSAYPHDDFIYSTFFCSEWDWKPPRSQNDDDDDDDDDDDNDGNDAIKPINVSMLMLKTNTSSKEKAKK